MDFQYWVALPFAFMVIICVGGLIAKRFKTDDKGES